MKTIFYYGFMILFMLLPLSIKAQDVEKFIDKSVEFKRLLNEVDDDILTNHFEVESMSDQLNIQLNQMNQLYESEGRYMSTDMNNLLAGLHLAMGWDVSPLFHSNVVMPYLMFSDTFEAYKIKFEKKSTESIAVIYLLKHQVANVKESNYLFFNSIVIDDKTVFYSIKFNARNSYKHDGIYYDDTQGNMGFNGLISLSNPLSGCEESYPPGDNKAVVLGLICDLQRKIISR